MGTVLIKVSEGKSSWAIITKGSIGAGLTVLNVLYCNSNVPNAQDAWGRPLEKYYLFKTPSPYCNHRERHQRSWHILLKQNKIWSGPELLPLGSPTANIDPIWWSTSSKASGFEAKKKHANLQVKRCQEEAMDRTSG